MSLKDKVALITGSTSGIGLGIAKALADEGVHVMLNGLGSREDNAQAISEVAGKGVTAEFLPKNLMDAAACRELVTETQAEFGRLDILINNAGMQYVAPIEDFPDEKWNAILALNLSAAFHTMKASVPIMRTAGFGRIINVASAHSLRASPHKAAYVAAKHGLAGLTKVVAVETARDNITANAISPGYVWTPLVEEQIPDLASSQGISEQEAKEQILEKQPSKEFATVEQIGALAVFLAGDAAEQITGANHVVDGGWTAQ